VIRLLFVDDHPAIADGLKARYGGRAGFVVVGAVSNVEAAAGSLASGDVDVAVVDVQLGQVIGPRDVERLAARAKVVLYTARASDPAMVLLREAGAHAVIDKAAPLEALDDAIRAAFEGRTIEHAPTALATGVRGLLSEREYEVYRALARCQTPKEVAASLGISRSTTYCHIDNVRRKLGLRSLQEIVAHALGHAAP